jgi:hypothetical protein
MPQYEADHPTGTRVRVRSRDRLERFAREWRYHHPLVNDQLECAGEIADVAEVGFYHGGAPLYTLRGLPGIWHEQCLELA